MDEMRCRVLYAPTITVHTYVDMFVSRSFFLQTITESRRMMVYRGEFDHLRSPYVLTNLTLFRRRGLT